MNVADVNESLFWAKVDRTGGDDACWPWLASLNNSGYGHFKVKSKIPGAHRVSYTLLVGDIPQGLQLDHLCKNRKCVNPAHLEPVTQRENTLRGESFSAVCARKTICPQGHPYDDSNTSYYKGSRCCRECARLKARRIRAKARKAVAANG